MKKLIFFILNPLKTVILTLCLFTYATAALANSTTINTGTASTINSAKTLTHLEIGEKAVAYVKALFPAPEVGELSYKFVPLDRRIKIKPCDDDLHLAIPGSASLSKRTAVQISCHSPKSWNLYVQVKITKMIPVVVAKHNLAPGSVITSDSVAVIMKDSTQIRGRALQQPRQLFGAKASRYITAGQAVTLRQVCLVCKGDMVTIVA
ncbi:MAG: flagellar basal body P-ring formation chaperone FlgA [Psychrosphaera sp.]|nr:flagellar basal body P-ring formation chaperone FlgA [Psychrosphaera sp.]